ncbi:hypothetical protein [Actinocorallia populi]|uniref:hypothetical protein n=1 Tax=Actinocorallia populi TaxID=2079200 RepID=UPI001300B554|nr:hypothetical protein [Actinocorallia populi]
MNEKRKGTVERAQARQAWRDWLPGVAVMAALAVVQEAGLFGSDGSARVAWSLANAIPALLLGWAVWRGLRRADEYQRVLQLEAMALGFGCLLFGVFVAGLLDASSVGDLRRSVQISLAASVLVWAAALELRGRAR